MATIWIYLAVLVLPALMASGEIEPRLRRSSTLLVGALLLAFIGLRREVGADWDTYLVIFRRAQGTDWLEALTLGDPGFMALNLLIARLDLGFGVVNLCAATVLTVGLLRLAGLQARPHLALLIALPVLVVIAGLSATRQSIALGLMCWALADYAVGRPRRAGFVLAAAPLMHWSALVLGPLIPHPLLRRWPPGWMFAAAGAGLGLLAAVVVLGTPALAAAYHSAGVSAGALFRAVPTALTLAVYLALGDRLPGTAGEKRVLVGLAGLAGLTLALSLALPTAGDRMGFYAVPFQMMVLPRALDAISRPMWRLAAHGAVASMVVVLLAGWLRLTPYAPCFAPYRSYLADPAALISTTAETPRVSPACEAVREPDPPPSRR